MDRSDKFTAEIQSVVEMVSCALEAILIVHALLLSDEIDKNSI
jgi:hypothetical protein